MAGRKSGAERSVLLTAISTEAGGWSDADGWIVIASNVGADNDPNWWLNLKAADGRGKVRVAGGRTLDIQAVELQGDARAEVWQRAISIEPSFEKYQEWTDRPIPVVRLQPVA